MFAVIFEVEPAAGQQDAYLAEAAALRPILTAMDGFIDNRRFRHTDGQPGLLSLSLWRDEAALIGWRSEPRHRIAQARGRAGIFSRYRIRIGRVMAPDETTGGPAIILSDANNSGLTPPPWPEAAGAIDQTLFTSLLAPERFLRLASWPAGAALPAPAPEQHRIAVVRNYTMTDRAEAPQKPPT